MVKEVKLTGAAEGMPQGVLLHQGAGSIVNVRVHKGADDASIFVYDARSVGSADVPLCEFDADIPHPHALPPFDMPFADGLVAMVVGAATVSITLAPITRH